MACCVPRLIVPLLGKVASECCEHPRRPTAGSLPMSSGRTKILCGGPRSMTMGTIASPLRHDTAARDASPSAKLRQPAALHYAPWRGLTILQEAWPISGLSVNAGIDVMCPFAAMTADQEIIENSKRRPAALAGDGLNCQPWRVVLSTAQHTLVANLDLEDFGQARPSRRRQSESTAARHALEPSELQ